MQNGVMLQFFHWYYPADGSLWNTLKTEAPQLAEMGITAVWLPPAFKADTGGFSVGYDVYDLYDLGEFDQKFSLRTKYGTRQEYVAAITAAKAAGLQVYADIVVNHKAGADEKELIKVVKVDAENRTETISEPYDIEAFTKFTFPGRNKKYSDFEWDHTCFSGIDFDALKNETGVYKIMNDAGEGWEEMIDDEKGNYDYLMYADVEFRNIAVREELKRWGKWYIDIAGFDGVRLDAVKHISPDFYNEWLDHMRAETKQPFFAVGEYWAPGNLALLEKYIERTDKRMSLFDAALHQNFHQASEAGKDYDMSAILHNSLVSSMPALAVTVVDNHDTQPLQALEAPVAAWFKPLAYALILLRQEGYPCIFYPDIYGTSYKDKGNDGNEYEINIAPVAAMEKLLWLRKNKALGTQHDYFDHVNCIAWMREGENETGPCIVIMSNGDEGFKTIEAGAQHAGKKFVDHLGNREGHIVLNENGAAEFYCAAGSVSAWILEK